MERLLSHCFERGEQFVFDLVIKNGQVIDGTGETRKKLDVGIKGERVTMMAPDIESECAEKVIDAEGLFVVPGFVDLHSHTDQTAFVYPVGHTSLAQGVTTCVTGNCGNSVAPLDDRTAEEFSRSTLPGRVGKEAASGAEITWRTLDEYFSHLEDVGLGYNLSSLVGHGTIRDFTAPGVERPMNADEVAAAQSVLRDAFYHGANGLSFGLQYIPGSYSDLHEIAALCRVAAEYDRFCSFHIRDNADSVVEAIGEVIEVARRSGARVHISHHNISGVRNWGKSEQSLQLIDRARNEGIEVTFDMYSYYINRERPLLTFVQDWLESSSLDGQLDELADPDVVSRLQEVAAKELPDNRVSMTPLARLQNWTILNARTEPYRDYNNEFVTDVARELDMDPVALVCAVLVAEKGRVKIARPFYALDVNRVLRHPAGVMASDTYNFDLPIADDAHYFRRTFGTFPRFLESFVNRQNLFSLEHAIYKITAMPAAISGLTDRGVLAPGKFADIVLLDSEEVADTSSYSETISRPKGIEKVLVGGQIVKDGDSFTEAKPGRPLRL